MAGYAAWLWGGRRNREDEGFERGGFVALGGSLFRCGEIAIAWEEDVVVLDLGFFGDGEVECVFCEIGLLAFVFGEVRHQAGVEHTNVSPWVHNSLNWHGGP